MSQKTSTAALANREWQSDRRRAPRHPAGRKWVAKQGSKKVPKKHSFRQALVAVQQEDVMSRNDANKIGSELRTILPVILRITFSLVLWTLGGATMTFSENQTRGASRNPCSFCDPMSSTNRQNTAAYF